MSFYTLNNDIEKHYLQHEYAKKPTLIEEPIGWKTSNKKISRSKKTWEIIEKNAKSVEFIGKGRNYIKVADAIHGSNLQIRYTIIKQNPKDATDFFEDVYFLDLETIEDKEGKLSCKIDEGGLSKILKSKGNEKVEIDRETSITGDTISSLKTEELEISGRKIFLKSLLEKNSDVDFFQALINNKLMKHNVFNYAIPLKISQNSHIDFLAPVANTSMFLKTPNSSQIFFTDNDREKKLKIKINGSMVINPYFVKSVKDAKLKIFLTKYVRNITTDTLEEVAGSKMLITEDKNASKSGQRQLYANFYKEITLLKNETLCFHVEISLGIYLFTYYFVFFTNINFNITITEDSEYQKSTTECLYPHYTIDRLLEIITGKKGLFKSNFLGRKEIGYSKDGKGAFSLIYPLLWVRKFKKKPNQPKPSISLNDVVNSINAIWGCSTMIEKKGFTEYLRLEDYNFFYVHKPLIELPNVVEKLKVTYATGFMHTSYEVGYEKGGNNYEETTGIGEYNGSYTYTTIRNREERKKVVKSKIRADVYAEEFARRKPFLTHGQEDTRYDSDWFIKDAKNVNGILKERKFGDDYLRLPTGIDSPETATNLRFTPLDILRRYAFFITGNLHHYKNTELNFTSSNCNANIALESRELGKLKGNQNILIKNLGKSRFQPYWYEFEHDVDFDIQKKLRGKSVVNGNEVYNFYGIVRFKVEENKYKYGYLFEVQENKGKWKVLLANY